MEDTITCLRCQASFKEDELINQDFYEDEVSGFTVDEDSFCPFCGKSIYDIK